VEPATEAIAADARLLAAARRRIHPHLVEDRATGFLTGSSFLIVIGAWLALAPPASVPVGAFVACVLVFVVAASVEFEIGPGCALPTTPVQVVMLFLLPPVLVPYAVLLGLVGAAAVARRRDPERQERFVVLAASAWQVVGPAAVFAVAGAPGPRLAAIPVLLVALGAQLTLDLAVSWVRNCHGLDVPPRQLLHALAFTFVGDLALAPIGFVAVRAFPDSIAAPLVLLPLILLLGMLQADRRTQLDRTVALGIAYTDTNDLARRDPLTGIANRLAFEESCARIRSTDAPVGVVLADVDGLKVANDGHGHATGDRLLRSVADAVAGVAADRGATAFRIGGDEFVLLLPGGDATATADLGTALRAAIADEPPIDGVVVVSASVGAGSATRGLELSRAMAEADVGAAAEKLARGAQRR
jgi:diguanylate cyclase (GGDEF)-like protein